VDVFSHKDGSDVVLLSWSVVGDSDDGDDLSFHSRTAASASSTALSHLFRAVTARCRAVSLVDRLAVYAAQIIVTASVWVPDTACHCFVTVSRTVRASLIHSRDQDSVDSCTDKVGNCICVCVDDAVVVVVVVVDDVMGCKDCPALNMDWAYCSHSTVISSNKVAQRRLQRVVCFALWTASCNPVPWKLQLPMLLPVLLLLLLLVSSGRVLETADGGEREAALIVAEVAAAVDFAASVGKAGENAASAGLAST
jgi:hypothetical protein